MLKIKEWLYDFYVMTEDNSIRVHLDDLWDIQVSSLCEANERVNARIDAVIAWMETFRR
jgi:hypothetical protein